MIKRIITKTNKNICNIGFCQLGESIIPLIINKNNELKRLTLEETNRYGAPVPSQKDEYKYKKWCLLNNFKYNPPIFSSVSIRKY